jgi:hypothetical protein
VVEHQLHLPIGDLGRPARRAASAAIVLGVIDQHKAGLSATPVAMLDGSVTIA